MEVAERIRGCVFGGAIGDALGAPVEFSPLTAIRDIYGPDGLDRMSWHDSGRIGAITDDTQMTLFTLEGIIRARGHAVPEAVFAAHRRWYGTQMLARPPKDERPQKLSTGQTIVMDGWLAGHDWLYARRAPGNACLAGLRFGHRGTAAAPANPHSKGCGAVMRSAPFGLNPSWPPAEAFALAVECGVQTHGHPSGHLAAGAFAAIVRRLLDGTGLREAVTRTLGTLRADPGGGEVAAALDAALAAAGRGSPTAERVEALGAGWVAEEALAMSVYCALARPGDVAAALLLAVNHSGDSDSTGAITGNLLGVQLGERALPTAWTSVLEGRETISALADDFVRSVSGTADLGLDLRYPAGG